MKHPFSLITVFNSPDQNFRGNTSVVALLDAPLSEGEFQELASDFNQPATTYLWEGSNKSEFHVRWFAPDAEIGLCGHGSLAAIAFLGTRFPVVNNFTLKYREGAISGKFLNEDTCAIWIDPIPVDEEIDASQIMKEGLGIPIKGYFKTGNKHIVLTNSEADVKNMTPDFAKLRESKVFGYVVTAPGDDVDFVSRTLVPHVQQLEDHATGSSHAVLTPFWAERLDKVEMRAHQLSPRGGRFNCSIDQAKVKLSGHFRLIATGNF